MKTPERTATWRREQVVLRVSRLTWRLEQAERECARALARPTRRNLDPHAGGRSRALPGPGAPDHGRADLDGMDAAPGELRAAGWRALADSVRCPGRLSGVTGGMQIILYGRSSKCLNPAVRTCRTAAVCAFSVTSRVTQRDGGTGCGHAGEAAPCCVPATGNALAGSAATFRGLTACRSPAAR